MPLYEYECEAENGRRFEIIQKFSDEPLTVCPSCGGPVRRLISSPAIQFKGSGWYVTDYAKTTKSDKSESESSSEAKPEKSDKAEKKTKESSPSKKTADKSSAPKASTGD